MNSSCPTCNAVYAVAPKDVGRKIKCKKCGTALRVDESGLVADAPAAAAPPPVPSAPLAAAVVEEDDDEVVAPRGKKARRFGGGGGDFLKKIGGVPTILFGIGTFLVIWFTFMSPIGDAGAARTKFAVKKLENEIEAKAKNLLPKGKRNGVGLSEDEQKKYNEDLKKLTEDNEKSMEAAKDAARNADIDNVRSAVWDKWGQLFGFLFLAFGCIGYLRTEQPLVLRVVAGVVLSFMLMVVFATVGGGCGGGPRLPLGKGD